MINLWFLLARYCFFDVQANQVRFAASLFVVCGLRLVVCFVLMKPHSAAMGFLCCTIGFRLYGSILSMLLWSEVDPFL